MNQVKPDVLDILMTAVHLAATELAQVHPQSESLEKSIAIWQQYLVQQAVKKQNSMSGAEGFSFRLTHLLFKETTPTTIPCDTCGGSGECQGIPARKTCGNGCECNSVEDCPTGGECAVCGGEGVLEVAQ
jgi:hypothetical protein